MTKRGVLNLACVIALGLFSAAPAPAAGGSGLAVRRRIHVGGEGGWDLLAFEPASRRLFLSHAGAVEVVDTRADSAVGRIADTPGVHGIAFAPERGRGYTSNGRDSSVTVFDLATLAPIARIKLDQRNPDVIVYDAVSGRVFTFNGGSSSATAIDAGTNAVIGNVALGGKPEFAALDGAGTMFVNLEDSSAVVRIDTRTLKPLARWPLAPGEEPTGLAIDREHHRLFASCSNQKLIVLDSETGRVVADLPIGRGVDGDAFDAKRSLVFTSNGEGTISVIRQLDANHYEVADTVATERGARTLALDETSGTIYLPTADFGPTPQPTAERPNPRPTILPGTFRVLVVGR
jgi:YVTN family beta-propeller protein